MAPPDGSKGMNFYKPYRYHTGKLSEFAEIVCEALPNVSKPRLNELTEKIREHKIIDFQGLTPHLIGDEKIKIERHLDRIKRPNPKGPTDRPRL